MDRKNNQQKKSGNSAGKKPENLASSAFKALYEQEREKNRQLYDALFRNQKTVMLMVDPESLKIVDANQAAVDFYGYPYDVLVQMDALQINPLIGENKLKQNIGKVLRSEQYVFTAQHKLANQEVRHVEVRSGKIRYEGRDLLFVSVYDITSRIKAQNELAMSEEKFRKAFKISQDAININRMEDGLYVEINDGFTAITGFTAEDVKGKTSADINIWADREDRNKVVETLKKQGYVKDYAAHFRMKNGRTVHGLMSANIIDIDGVPHILSVTRCIEEQVKMQRSLEQSETKFRKAFDISPFAIAITGLHDGRYLEVNRVFMEETGYKRHEIIGKTAEELQLWEDFDNRKKFQQEIVEKGFVKDYPVNLKIKNGRIVHALVSSNVIELGGNPYLISITRSIENYREALRALRKSELRYKALFDLSPAGIVVLDDTGTILEANPSFCRLLSLRPDEIIGKKVWDSLYPVAKLKKESVLHDIREILASPTPIQKDVVNYDKNGQPVYLQLYESAIVLEKNRPAILSISMDITREKEFRNQLARQAERLKEAQDIGRLGSWELEWKSRKLSWSDGLYRILELAPAQVKPDYGLFQKLIYPDDLKTARQVLKDSIREGKSFKYIHRLKLKTGKIKWVIERGKSFYDARGEVVRTHGTVQDITRLKEVEDQLKELNEKLEEKVRDRTVRLKKKQQDLSRLLNDMQQVQQKLRYSNQALQNLNHELEAFSYSVSHDLKAPLRAIHGFSSILKEDYYHKLDEAGQTLVDDIVAEARRMGEIIDALLLLSRTGRKNLNYVEFDLKPLVRSLFSEQQKHFNLPHARLEMTAMPTLLADYSLVKQLVANLLSNALKYSSKEPVPVVEFGSLTDKNRGELVFYVKDNGVGFDESSSEKMFNAFSRLHTKKDFEGTGIGLAIARRIVVRHGGKIWAHGEKGAGATFYFTLPEKPKIPEL